MATKTMYDIVRDDYLYFRNFAASKSKYDPRIDPADLAHDALVRVLSRDMSHVTTQQKTFICTIILHNKADFFRKKRREQPLPRVNEVSTRPDISATAVYHELLTALETALEAYPSFESAEIFREYALEGVPCSELVQRYGVSALSIRERICRVRRYLRQELARFNVQKHE